jgi:phage gp46-like protein
MSFAEFRKMYSQQQCRDNAEDYAEQALKMSMSVDECSDSVEKDARKQHADTLAKVAGIYLAASLVVDKLVKDEGQ